MSGIGFPERATDGFHDRGHAGRVLAQDLTGRDWFNPVVLGLARGGVPVAAEVARALEAPLRVSVARKIGAPDQPELALGAVTAQGPPSYDRRLLEAFHLDENMLADSCAREQEEAQRRETRYQQGPALDLVGRDVILVDDGLATGATAIAAVRMLRAAGPRAIVLAVPVGSPDAVAALDREADTVVCVLQPTAFSAVGQWYRDFHPTGDTEIMRTLRDLDA